MDNFQRSVVIDAPPERVWATTLDIERWPEWTSTVTRARVLDKGLPRPGARVLIRQPGLPPAVWRVTAFEPPHRIELRSGFPGMRVVALHSMVPHESGGTPTLSLRFAGWLGRMLGRLTSSLNHRYLEIEAAGIKQHCEAAN